MRGYFLLRPTFLPCIVINLLLLCFSLEMGIAKVTRVAILPFQTNADENIDYINRGIREMLTARVTYGADIFVVERRVVKDALSRVLPSELTTQGVQEIGSSLGVDYVIFGSISKIGNNVSIDISILNVLQGGITKPVFAQSVGLNEVIPKVNSIAQEIVDTISTGFESLPPAKSSVQLPVIDETLLEKGEKSGGVEPERVEKVDLTASDGTSEIPKPSSDEVEEESGSLDEHPTEPEGLKENFLKRKSDINSLDENPVYQKSVNELEEPKPSSNEVEEESGSLDEHPTEPEGLEETSSKRKNEINSLDENPVYQKSVNELDKNAETANDAISEQE
jgi:TolB-like protein